MKTEQKRLSYFLIAPIVLLMIPFIAYIATDEVNWSVGDFLVGGLVLYGLAIGAEIIIRKTKSKRSKYALLIIVLLFFVLLWAELAVGVFGTPIAGS